MEKKKEDFEASVSEAFFYCMQYILWVVLINNLRMMYNGNITIKDKRLLYSLIFFVIFFTGLCANGAGYFGCREVS